MSSEWDSLDTRVKGEVVLGARKLSELEQAGLTVVDRNRLKALERLYGACQRQKAATKEITRLAQPGGYMSHDERKAWKRLEEAEDEVWKIVEELEAMER